MARTNVRQPRTPVRTHEGAPARRVTSEQALRRSVLACLLWEKTFYEEGEDIATRIMDLVQKVDADNAASLAIQARSEYRLRHAPLWMCVGLARNKGLHADTLTEVIQRADELTEFLSLYWKDGKVPLAAQVKKGLAKAFRKFDAYQLGKYNRDEAIKLRDVLFMVHAKPKDEVQDAVWKNLVAGTLEAPDTWEVALSGGQNKKETWERLLSENKLGYMALLRNLRNMRNVEVPEEPIFAALREGAGRSKALPFRFIAAAKAVPQWEPVIEEAMLVAAPKATLKGRTILLVDVSGSMTGPLSSKSDINRVDAASGLAILAREMCEKVAIFSFSGDCVPVPPRHGFALRDAIDASQMHGSTYLGKAVEMVNGEDYDRLIVITDEQSHDRVPNPKGTGYVINVAAYENGVGYGPWTHIDGFSEAVLTYIAELEKENFQ